jgi:hypothetical protein
MAKDVLLEIERESRRSREEPALCRVGGVD